MECITFWYSNHSTKIGNHFETERASFKAESQLNLINVYRIAIYYK